MDRLVLGALALLLCAQPGSAAAQEPATTQGPACETLDSCIAALIAAAQARRQVSDPVRQRLPAFGEAAVDTLVPLLMDPDLYVRESAGLALTNFPRIDPRHLPALVRAWREGDTVNSHRRGNGWLPRPIAATGTDEALRLLWQDFLRDPQQGSNAQTFFALAWAMPERVRPLLTERMAACRDDAGGGACAGIYGLLRQFRPPFPAWSVTEIVNLAEHARSDDVRRGAELMLVQLSHPAALAPLQRRLAAFPPEDGRGDDGRWQAGTLIRSVASYGGAARASAPAVIPYLGAAFDEDLRADAALALGRIENPSAVPALLAMAPELADDWVLAYNVAESLGRLRATEARTLLQQLAREHWHRGVRRNAARALSAMAGGPFADPAVSGDGALYPSPRGADGEEYLYFGKLRFAGDDAAHACHPSRERRQNLAQDPVGILHWPRRGAEALSFTEMTEAAGQYLRGRIPLSVAQGEVVLVLPIGGGDLVGVNGGEFGGGLVHVRDRGAPVVLMSEPIAFAWRVGNRLYVAAGLAHLVLDIGHLYVVDSARRRVERVVRLPASPRRLLAASGRAAVIDTGAGQVAIREDGQLIDVERIDGCTET